MTDAQLRPAEGPESLPPESEEDKRLRQDLRRRWIDLIARIIADDLIRDTERNPKEGTHQ